MTRFIKVWRRSQRADNSRLKVGRGQGIEGANPARAQAAPNPNGDVATEEKQQPVRVEKQIGRNDPCPCGSGKKYKACHGK